MNVYSCYIKQQYGVVGTAPQQSRNNTTHIVKKTQIEFQNRKRDVQYSIKKLQQRKKGVKKGSRCL